MKKEYYITIFLNNSDSFSIDITNDMFALVNEEKTRSSNDLLVYYERKSDHLSAKVRKESLELWTKEKLKKLVQSLNPDFKDVSFIWQRAFNLNF